MNIKISLRLVLFAFVSLLSPGITRAQTSKKDSKAAAIQNLVQSKSFVFKAQYAMPLGGRNIFLTSDYDVRITNDSLVCYLPYYGRAYEAPINPNEGGIQFTSTSFGYSSKQTKKGNWYIEVTPKDNTDVRKLNFSVSQSGYGNLQVTSNSRQEITFNGYIKAAKKR